MRESHELFAELTELADKQHKGSLSTKVFSLQIQRVSSGRQFPTLNKKNTAQHIFLGTWWTVFPEEWDTGELYLKVLKSMLAQPASGYIVKTG